MFRNRKRQDALPMSGNAAPSSFHFPSPGTTSSYSMADGSGKAIRMEAPLARAWKRASVYTKGSYYSLITCILFTYFGYRWLRWNNASISLVCHSEECTLSLTPHGWNGNHWATFPRSQLVNVEAIKVTHDGDFVALSPRLDNFLDDPPKGKNKNKKQSTSYKGPDKNGHYASYRITLRESSGEATSSGDAAADSSSSQQTTKDESLAKIKQFLDPAEGDTYTFTVRKMRIYQSRRRVKTYVQKLDSYIRRRRHKLTVKENTPPSWQGILLLVVGLFGFVLTLLIGQFTDQEDAPKKRQGGPGTRMQSPTDYSGKRPSVASNPRKISKAY